MTPSYFYILLGLPLLCICSCNAANITLQSSPEHVVSTSKNVETAFYCWASYDINLNVIVSLKHNGRSLDVYGGYLRIAPGQCDQDLVPDGMHCENVTVHIPGDMSLDQTTLTCSLLQLITEDGFYLIERSERLNVTINIDDCGTDNGGCNQTCTDTIGSFVCSCGLGYELNEDGLGCSDINECGTDNGGCNQDCTNTIGSFVCSCGSGYELNEDGLLCSDIDECDRDLDNCDIIATCTNTVEGYDCKCIAGFEGTGFFQDCSNIDECVRRTDNCGMNATCTDTSGSFFCTCLDGFRGNGIICAEISTPPPLSNGSLVTVISVSVSVGVLVIILLILITVGVLIVRWRKKTTHDNQHIYESVSLYALEMQYNITVNDAYVPGTSASAAQQNAANSERPSSKASHRSHEAIEGDEMRGISRDQTEHERDASVCYQAGDDYEQAQCYELAGGAYERVKGQDYEQTSDPYERVQDYEQQQASASGPYDQFRGQDYEQTSDPYDRVQDYEQQQASASGPYDQVQSYEWLKDQDYEQTSDPYERVQDYEQQQASGSYDQIQSYKRLQVSDWQDPVQDNPEQQQASAMNSYMQAHTAYEHIQGYKLVVQSRYCGLLQLEKISQI